MRVLFVCRSNAGRSQVAMELYNQLHPGEADSAGTQVDKVGQKLKDRPTARGAIEVMREIGIDMSENTRRQLTPDMLANYDRIVVLAETKSIPSYLNTYPGAEFWHVEDFKAQPVKESLVILDDIKGRVDALSERLNS